MQMNHPLSDENGKRIIAETLRLFVGRGKSISWEDLAEAVGEKPGTLRTYAATPPVEIGSHRPVKHQQIQPTVTASSSALPDPAGHH